MQKLQPVTPHSTSAISNRFMYIFSMILIKKILLQIYYTNSTDFIFAFLIYWSSRYCKCIGLKFKISNKRFQTVVKSNYQLFYSLERTML